MLLPLLVILTAGCLLPEKKQWNADEDEQDLVRRSLMVPGEKLSYEIRSGIFTLGQAQLAIQATDNDAENFELSLLANSTHPWLPSLSYTYKSIVNREDLSTVAFETEETEKSEIKKAVTFRPDYSQNKGAYTRMKRRSTRKGILNFDTRVYDYISMLYFLRQNMPEPGESAEIAVFNETEIVELKMKNLALREVEIRGVGKFKAYILKPRRAFEGIFFRKGDIMVWIDETYKIPLRFIIKLPFGVATIDLVKVENTQSGAVLFQ